MTEVVLRNFANAIRVLSIDMVNAASSGHQGTPLGFADVISVLFNKSMNFDPNNPNRDRLILSSGHASAMLYSAIYLTQKTTLKLDDLKNFRKFGGICQGHPEINKDLGIEMTTGALGQGIATSVGIALGLKKKNADNKVFVIVGDGCLMEGISHESMTFASSLNLNNLIVLFDNNNTCIDGKASDYTTDNIIRFKAYGFEVFEADGHDYDDIYNKIELAKKSNKPSFISFKTVIGYPSKESGTNKCHGKFLSFDDAKSMRKDLGFPESPFSLPEGILWKKEAGKVGIVKKQVTDNFENKLHESINLIKKSFIDNPVKKSTRYFGGYILGKLCENFEFIIGGSADLSESNCMLTKTHKEISKNSFDGNYVHYGIREHAMGCIMNGLAIEGFIPYGGTFLVFSDYMRAAIRNAALMKIASIFVFTHDSVAVGEDGATHQPIEQLSSLRLMPNLQVLRPACDIETAECIEIALSKKGTPAALILSRQNLENVRKYHIDENLCQKGMYELIPFENNMKSKFTIIASGSEVSLALRVRERIENFDVRIISAPSLELFELQSKEYKNDILEGKKLFLEAGKGDLWHKYKTNSNDKILSIEDFGESGTENDLFKKFGFAVENILKLIES